MGELESLISESLPKTSNAALAESQPAQAQALPPAAPVAQASPVKNPTPAPEAATPATYVSRNQRYAPALSDRSVAEALLALHARNRRPDPGAGSRVIKPEAAAEPEEAAFAPARVPEVATRPKSGRVLRET